MFDIIAFDADDTLWHNEVLYHRAQEAWKEVVERHSGGDDLDRALYQTEMRNIGLFGYGIKSFILSMIETAIASSSGAIPGQDVQRIIDIGRDMLAADVELLDHVAPVVSTLARSHSLMLITKGDLLDQQTKLSRSGLAEFFQHVEVVSEKTPQVYAALLEKHGIRPDRFIMVGNSMRSDILPVLELGSRAVYVPYHLVWEHERADDPGIEDRPGYHQVEHIGELPSLVAELESRGGD